MQGAIFGDGALVPGVTAVIAVLVVVVLVFRLGRRSGGQRRVASVQRLRPDAAVVLVSRTLALDLAAERFVSSADARWEPGAATDVVASAGEDGLVLWLGAPGEMSPVAVAPPAGVRSAAVDGLTVTVTAAAGDSTVELPLAVQRKDSTLESWTAFTTRLQAFAGA
ncbi:hypothetical protein GCM10010988_30180 [Cnuibacter physcomitrellae]|uniref:Uncharacterized protein n=1 Tax=Cnuibacter physcomitrellae TaxID=1619308 RepID=A0A1X9LID6_9MICO|nr:hypothetical protein [Cnuibacter physcomitrellae]ARJ04272.1 hypothetical protein B5808_02785 [Cnuibacter physcomitrellae]GGI40658.1 hypothetical protein GCM10010988_30180 [Cnuibacter physcomitrellae]